MPATVRPEARDALRAKAQLTFATLNDHFGTPEFTGGDDPVDELIATILSANTNDTNTSDEDRAWPTTNSNPCSKATA